MVCVSALSGLVIIIGVASYRDVSTLLVNVLKLFCYIRLTKNSCSVHFMSFRIGLLPDDTNKANRTQTTSCPIRYSPWLMPLVINGGQLDFSESYRKKIFNLELIYNVTIFATAAARVRAPPFPHALRPESSIRHVNGGNGYRKPIKFSINVDTCSINSLNWGINTRWSVPFVERLVRGLASLLFPIKAIIKCCRPLGDLQ